MRLNFLVYLAIVIIPVSSLLAQPPSSTYMAELKRSDGLPIRFNFSVEAEQGKPVWVIRNAEERIRVTDIRTIGDSIKVSMPLFESDFLLRKQPEGGFEGNWIKGTTGAPLVMPVVIRPGSGRFTPQFGNAQGNVTGRWSVTFTRPNGTSRPAVAELRQKGNQLTGTFMTPSGDYRYLEGVMSGDSLQLSCFDGSHAYFIGARLGKDGKLVNGVFASSATWLERWYAARDAEAALDETLSTMQLRPGEEKIGFRFPDLDSQWVSLSDARFRDKVVVIQIMGSWCPNCMDETSFLSNYYRINREKGVEVIALAYEYTTDFQRARRNLGKFRDKFNVQYPMLITGVTSADSLKTEKTLPQLTPIKAFPTTIFIGRDGKVKKIHAGFYGPGAGEYHEQFKLAFEATIQSLLRP